MSTVDGIDELPSGHFRFRFQASGKTFRGTFATLEEAVAMRDEAKRLIASGKMVVTHAASVVQLGASFKASRDGNRAHGTEIGRWDNHIATAAFARRPVSTVTPRDVRDWLDRLKAKETSYAYRSNVGALSWQTRKHCLNLLRAFFHWAILREHTTKNPCAGITVARQDGDEAVGYQDGWYLDDSEQARFLAVELEDVDAQRRWERERLIVQFGLGTGLRLRELCCLHLADVHADTKGVSPFIDVKYGSWDRKKKRYRSPKGRKGEKKSRRVELLGPALEAARLWLAQLATYAPKNPLGLMFPTERGARRDKPPRSWTAVVNAFGVVPRIGRKMWWHLLRHTCASSLIAGWWGDAGHWTTSGPTWATPASR